MSNDKRAAAVASIASNVMATYADSPMGTTHAVEMAAEKAYDLGKYHGRQEAMESGEAWAKFRADMGPGVGPAWTLERVCPRGNGNKTNSLVLVCDDASPVLMGRLHHFMTQHLPVDVVAYPAAPATNERDAFEAIGHRRGMEDALDIVTGCEVDDTKFKAQADLLRDAVAAARGESFAAGFADGLRRARDLLAAQADETEALARGQAAEAEVAAAHAAEMQTRAAASATRAAVQRGGVDLLNREIAALKGEGK